MKQKLLAYSKTKLRQYQIFNGTEVHNLFNIQWNS